MVIEEMKRTDNGAGDRRGSAVQQSPDTARDRCQLVAVLLQQAREKYGGVVDQLV